MVARAPGCGRRGNDHHDDAEPEHRQSHEFENECVHGKSPNPSKDGREALDGLLNLLVTAPALGRWCRVS
jgi:hypothetical protein